MVRISACVIVKNEEKNIGRWLENMRQAADEMVVVDTGSEDRTVELAEAAGARVFTWQWKGDFAAAKNYALDQARGEWILFLDADEYFSRASLQRVRGCVEQYHRNRKVVGFICRLLNIDEDNNNQLLNETYQARIFRHLSTLRYVRSIHEGLYDSVPGRRMQLLPELEIYHTGYSSRIFRAKCERDLQLLQQQIRQEGERPEHRLYLMKCWYGIGDYEKALAYADQVIADKTCLLGAEADGYEMKINCLSQLNRSTEERLEVVEAAMGHLPELSEFPLFQGIFLWEKKDYLQSETALQKGIAMYDAQSPAQAGRADNAVCLLPEACLRLGELALLQGNSEAALSYFLRGIHIQPYRAELLLRFYDMLAAQEPVEQIQLLNSLYDKEKDAGFLTQVLRQRRAGAVWLYYARLAGQNADIPEGYMAAERYDAAAIALADTLDGLYRLGIAAAQNMKRPVSGGLALLLPTAYRTAWQNPEAPADGIAASVRRMHKAWGRTSGAETAPLVSIMIPTYNRPELFEKTLQSALAQTYTPVEIIVCDNSTDERTAELMTRYTSDSRVRYVRNVQARTKEENFAPFEQLARGEYLQWLMDDDILMPEKLEKMVPVLREHPEVKMVTSERGVIDLDGNRQGALYPGMVKTKNEWALLDGKETGRTALIFSQNFLGEPSAVLFRRKDLHDHYWHADCRGYKTISDVAMWLELLENGYCAYFTKALSYFRRHAGQEGVQPDVALLARIEWYELTREYARRHIFIETDTDYAEALKHLYKDYEVTRETKNFYRDASPAMRGRYDACMQEVYQTLAGSS